MKLIREGQPFVTSLQYIIVVSVPMFIECWVLYIFSEYWIWTPNTEWWRRAL